MSLFKKVSYYLLICTRLMLCNVDKDDIERELSYYVKKTFSICILHSTSN